MNLYYCPEIQGAMVQLPEDEARHCTQVLRLKTGDELHLTNGSGGLYTAIIESINKSKVLVRILNNQKQLPERNYRIHIAISPTKNIDRLEWFLEKATEIGIDEITPIICEHSERRKIRTDRLERVIISAMKQSLKTFIPVLNELCSVTDFLNRDFSDQQFCIAHCSDGKKELIKSVYSSGDNIVIMIGPEGDFSRMEINKALSSGAKAISLGNSRLRTETAALVACHSVYFLNQL